MKLLIASDIHGLAEYCEKLTEVFEREQPERLLLLGDVLTGGPHAQTPVGPQALRTAELLNGIGDKVLCVYGNCDGTVDQPLLNFPLMEDYRSIYLEKADATVYATHGHRRGPNNVPPSLLPGDILLCGHTHVPAWQKLPGGVWYFNPGSVSLPRGGSPHSYMLMTDTEALWCDLLNGSCYHSRSLV